MERISLQDSVIGIDAEQLLMLMAVMLPEPTNDEVVAELQADRVKNPYNEPHLPKRRDERVIKAQIRVRKAMEIEHAVYNRTVVKS